MQSIILQTNAELSRTRILIGFVSSFLPEFQSNLLRLTLAVLIARLCLILNVYLKFNKATPPKVTSKHTRL